MKYALEHVLLQRGAVKCLGHQPDLLNSLAALQRYSLKGVLVSLALATNQRRPRSGSSIHECAYRPLLWSFKLILPGPTRPLKAIVAKRYVCVINKCMMMI